MSVAKLIDKELVYLNEHIETKEELYGFVADHLFQIGFVKKTYKEALIAREREYPTGLSLEGVNIGIPHTDCFHIEEPFIYLVKTKHSVTLTHMGTDDVEIPVHYLFFLGIKKPTEQVQLLQTLMDKFQDPEFVHLLKHIEENERLVSFLKKEFKE
ncbi:PTS sugar transporter subunit IIA [Metabacillus arenae]|uniref:PTS sugar transporter subunit IIA n=1 Tax=Metabacillus arenae TaxID=2771434 RepID=A0A926NRZ6_9BACI|nr:PTS sugar transporter subunit IIA [Metabacillus arenae]MBD1382806.1 PTS sugar transporter subunit IIA [Metabacillus arenae]